MGLNNDLSSIKVSVNNSLILPLENKKANSLLIFGNTINFFGRLDNDGNLALNEMNNNDRNHFFWLVKRLQQKTKVYIIGEAEEKEYYERLFKTLYNNFRLKVYYKFLETTNDDPKGYLTYMKQFNNMKFDYIVGNPPFGSNGNDVLHLKCTDMVYDKFNKKMIIIMPFSFISKVDHKVSKKYKEKFSEYLKEVSEFSSSNFDEVSSLANMGIYVFEKNKQSDEPIKINYLNGSSKCVNSLLNITNFSDYETEIMKYFNTDNHHHVLWAGGRGHCTKNSLAKLNITDPKEIKKQMDIEIEKNVKHLPQNKIYLTCNESHGGMEGKFFSTKNGEIFSDIIELTEMFKERSISHGYMVAIFNSIKAATNYKIALQNPLLRFICFKIQDDRTMGKVYKYVPAIDWEDPRCLTDEGLLEMCGCPSDKAKEYAEYVKNYVETRDKEIESRKKGKKK